MVLKCMTVVFKPILALHINFSSCRNYWGGGGQNDIFAPKYFHSGGGCPPAPQDRRLCFQNDVTP